MRPDSLPGLGIEESFKWQYKGPELVQDNESGLLGMLIPYLPKLHVWNAPTSRGVTRLFKAEVEGPGYVLTNTTPHSSAEYLSCLLDSLPDGSTAYGRFWFSSSGVYQKPIVPGTIENMFLFYFTGQQRDCMYKVGEELNVMIPNARVNLNCLMLFLSMYLASAGYIGSTIECPL
jgi:hypothetical protein